VIGSIPSPSANGFHIGPLDVHAYGLMYVLAVVAAVAITVRRWEKVGGSRSLVYEVAAWGFPAGVVGGRLYFDATSSNLVPDHWWGPLAIWQGGLGIWGGIAAGTLVGLVVLRRRGADIPRFLDAAAPALLVAQAIGRVGNYLNQELFGGPTSLPWGLQISPAHRPPGYEQFATFQPTFLYELIWNLALAALLVWLGRNRRIRVPGLFALYLTGYSAFRIFEELLRVDPAHHIFGLRLNFYVATLLFLGGFTWFVHTQFGPIRLRWRRGSALLLAGGALAICGCGQSARQGAPTSELSRGKRDLAPAVTPSATWIRSPAARGLLRLPDRERAPRSSESRIQWPVTNRHPRDQRHDLLVGGARSLARAPYNRARRDEGRGARLLAARSGPQRAV
jgi:prolipoprotein diacylglyceryl transferase